MELLPLSKYEASWDMPLVTTTESVVGEFGDDSGTSPKKGLPEKSWKNKRFEGGITWISDCIWLNRFKAGPKPEALAFLCVVHVALFRGMTEPPWAVSPSP